MNCNIFVLRTTLPIKAICLRRTVQMYAYLGQQCLTKRHNPKKAFGGKKALFMLSFE